MESGLIGTSFITNFGDSQIFVRYPSEVHFGRTLHGDSQLPLLLTFKESHCNQSYSYWPEHFHGSHSPDSCKNIGISKGCQEDFCHLTKCEWASFHPDQMHNSVQSSSPN
jgi:hypothetical protein